MNAGHVSQKGGQIQFVKLHELDSGTYALFESQWRRMPVDDPM
jgi:hypothetical protein